MIKDIFFFDLDGTVLDTGEGVINGVIYALSSYGISVPDRKQLFGFMGPPLVDSFMKYFAFPKDKAEDAVRKYREYYSSRGYLEFTPYAGMGELLVNLRNAGKKLMVATSKPAFYAHKVLEKCGFDVLFDCICGSEFDGTRSAKTDVLRYAVEQSGIADLKRGVMIGDREYDIDGAHAVGMEGAGILFGYGSEDEFRRHSADYIFAKPSDIYSFFIEGDLSAQVTSI